jgi:3-ketosteroid 9alpha-monooxygenase subunit B
MCTVEQGEVELLRNEALDQQELNEGWTLACQAVATSAHVRVRFPD